MFARLRVEMLPDFGDFCHQTEYPHLGSIMLCGLRSSKMLKKWPNKELVHILPFHPSTRCLRTGYKDADQPCSLV
eukprot:6867690-Prorocentrum_lima.AAC.1